MGQLGFPRLYYCSVNVTGCPKNQVMRILSQLMGKSMALEALFVSADQHRWMPGGLEFDYSDFAAALPPAPWPGLGTLSISGIMSSYDHQLGRFPLFLT